MAKYELHEKTGEEVGQFKVTIKADSNDGDYVTTINYYSQLTFESHIIDGLIELKYEYDGDHQLEDYTNNYDLDIPYNGWDGNCHTLEELNVEFTDDDGKVWDVIF